MSLFERAGGLDGIRRVVTAFYDAMFDDVMIGYLFRGQDKARLVAREVELMAEHFGAPSVAYGGRDLARAHGRHRIMGAHFDRRAVILEQTLDAHRVEPEVKAAWLEHTRALRERITTPGECHE